MLTTKKNVRGAFGASLALILASVLIVGCPEIPDLPGFPGPPGGGSDNPFLEYDRGLEDGFAVDEEYWDGYWDGYDTRDFGPIYYTGHEIPYIDDYSYEAGYWDGVWYAYNDGWFVNYRYAFILGWSEGYDLAYRPDYLNFLANDEHIEFLDGGWSDGYNDGFSEGRIFGAWDFEEGRAFDWLDAFWDYEDEIDGYFEEIDLGTGEFGPVILYNYGENPHELVKMAREDAAADAKRLERVERRLPSIRGKSALETKTKDDLGTMFRPMIEEARNELNTKPETSERAPDREFQHLEDTWLERIDTYRSFAKERVELPKSGRAASERAR